MSKPDYLYTYQMMIHDKLKRQIKAKIYVTIDYDRLYISIQNSDFTYNYEMRNIEESILNGFPTDRIVGNVISKYKEYIFNELVKKYFY